MIDLSAFETWQHEVEPDYEWIKYTHPTEKLPHSWVGSIDWPRHFFLMTTFTCPVCGNYTESFSDCPGYGGRVCTGSYEDLTITGKRVTAIPCGNALLYVCINMDCDWQWRTHNQRTDLTGVEPEWAAAAIQRQRRAFDEPISENN